MSQPESTGSFCDELYRRMLPLAYADEENGWALFHLCCVIGSMFQPIEDLVRDSDAGPGWSAIYDIDRCPSEGLPWLAQFRGVSLPPQIAGQSDEDYDLEMRDWIRRADGMNRGGPDAIVAAAQRRLTGTKTVTLSERDGGDAYQLVVSTLDDETPDPDGTLADIVSQKPAGLVLNHQESVSITWAALEAADADWTAVLAEFATWDEVRLNLP